MTRPAQPTSKVAHAVTGVPTVTNVAVAPSGANLAISFNLKVDGVNATDFSTLNRAYRFDGTTYGDLNAVGSTTPAAVSGGTGGNYTITVTNGATAYPANSRYAASGS